MKSSRKTEGYKYQLLQVLNKQDFEIEETGENEYWWDDEHWTIHYKNNSERSFMICFIVDPQFDGPRKKSEGVYEIRATSNFPSDQNDSEGRISSIYISKRNFNLRLKVFVNDLKQFIKA